MNGFDVQSDSDAMLERQRKDIMPRMLSTPRTPGSALRGSVFRRLGLVPLSVTVNLGCHGTNDTYALQTIQTCSC